MKHDSVWRDEKAFRLIKEGLCKYLIEAWNDGPRVNTIAYNVLRCMSESMEAGHTVNIYTFNYTPLPCPFDRIFEDNLFYVHGNSKSGSIIIGTRDGDYDEDYEFLQKAFDKHFSPPPIVADLMEADEIDDAAVRGLKRAINKLTDFKLSYFFSMNQVKIVLQANEDRTGYNNFIKAHISKDRIDEVIKHIHYD